MQRKNRDQAEFPDDLNEPIVRQVRSAPRDGPRLRPPPPAPSVEEDDLRVAVELLRRVDLLFQHYGISRSDERSWSRLALRLAFTFFDGFRIVDPPRQRGRRPQWKVLGPMLVTDVIKQTADGKQGVRDALRALVRRKAWKAWSWRTLEARYSDEVRRQEELMLTIQAMATSVDGPAIDQPLK